MRAERTETESERLAAVIGDAARTARVALELTQEEVAERAGISAPFYARIERGQTIPSTPTLARLAKALDTDADVLLGLDRADAREPPSDTDGDSAEHRKLIRRLKRADVEVIRLVVQVLRVLGRWPSTRGKKQ